MLTSCRVEGVDKQKAEEMFAAMEAKTGELAGQELGGMKSLGRRKLGIATVASLRPQTRRGKESLTVEG